MLHGLLLFHEGTGALLFQRRFSQGFGLSRAASEPSLADPVGLALQLYAFNKFCSGVCEASKLEYLRLNSTGSCISFAGAKIPNGAAGELPVILALFSELPRELGKQMVAACLEAFLAEQVVEPSETTKEVSSRLTPTRPGAAAAIEGGRVRFRSLESFLESALDFLVGAIVDRLPRVTPWLVMFFTSSPASFSPSFGYNGERPIAIPHAPIQPPPTRPRCRAGSGSGRPHLARRMLQHLPGGSFFATKVDNTTVDPATASPSPVEGQSALGPRGFDNVMAQEPSAQETFVAGSGTRCASAPPRASDRLRQKVQSSENEAFLAPEVPAQGKVSWWFSRRSKSQSAPSDTSLYPGNATNCTTEKGFTCYFYDSHGNGHYQTEVSGFTTSLWHHFVANLSSASSAAVLPIELPPGLMGTHGAATLVEVAMVSLLTNGRRLSVALPVSALQFDGTQDGSSMETNLEIVRSAFRTLNFELTMLSDYITFLCSLTEGQRASAKPHPHSSTPRRGSSRTAGSGSDGHGRC